MRLVKTEIKVLHASASQVSIENIQTGNDDENSEKSSSGCESIGAYLGKYAKS